MVSSRPLYSPLPHITVYREQEAAKQAIAELEDQKARR
jgi:hypothetical protein